MLWVGVESCDEPLAGLAWLEHVAAGNPSHVLAQPVPIFPRLEMPEEAV